MTGLIADYFVVSMFFGNSSIASGNDRDNRLVLAGSDNTTLRILHGPDLKDKSSLFSGFVLFSFNPRPSTQEWGHFS